jgi:hypothetical protein
MSAAIDIATSELAQDGYCILRRALDPAVLAALAHDLAPDFAATPMCKGVFYGPLTRRFGALLRRSPHAEALVRAIPMSWRLPNACCCPGANASRST